MSLLPSRLLSHSQYLRQSLTGTHWQFIECCMNKFDPSPTLLVQETKENPSMFFICFPNLLISLFLICLRRCLNSLSINGFISSSAIKMFKIPHAKHLPWALPPHFYFPCFLLWSSSLHLAQSPPNHTSAMLNCFLPPSLHWEDCEMSEAAH